MGQFLNTKTHQIMGLIEGFFDCLGDTFGSCLAKVACYMVGVVGMCVYTAGLFICTPIITGGEILFGSSSNRSKDLWNKCPEKWSSALTVDRRRLQPRKNPELGWLPKSQPTMYQSS